MDVKRYTPCNIGRTINRPIMLGKVGEINALRIEFDCEEWLTDYPDAAVELFVKRPDNDKYHPALGEDGYVRIWIIDERAVLAAGSGVIELELQDASSGTRIKSATGYTTVVSSPSAEGEASDLGFVTYSRAQNLTEAQKRQARNNIGAGTGTGTGTGSGTDGFSPTIKVEKIDGGHRLTITDIDDTKVVDVMDGKNGKNGDPGEDGRGIESVVRTSGDGSPGSTDVYTITYTDGYTSTLTVYNGKDGAAGENGVSPTVAVETIDGGHRVTITSADSPKSFEVMDGKTGDPGAPGAPGEKGEAGRGILNIARTSGDGSAGTVDTYTIYYTDGTESTYQVRNGADGKDGSNAEGGGSSVELDNTLTQSGKAADAKATGDALNELKEANATQDEEIAEKVNQTLFDKLLAKLGLTMEDLIERLPQVRLAGDLTGISGDDYVNVTCSYLDELNAVEFTDYAEIAYQGSSSINFTNVKDGVDVAKNYKIKLYSDEGRTVKNKRVFKDWFATNNFHIKANFGDCTNFMNNMMMHYLTASYQEITPLPRTGARYTVDGFPILLYINDVFCGVRFWNLKQDDKVYALNDENDLCYQIGLNNGSSRGDNSGAFVYGNLNSGSNAGKNFADAHAEIDYYWEDRVWDKTSNHPAVLYDTIQWVSEADDAEFVANLEQHFDKEYLIHYFVMMYACGMGDSICKNFNMLYFPEKGVWYPTFLDMDFAWGTSWSLNTTSYNVDILSSTYGASRLFTKLWENFTDECKEHYWALRESILTVEKVREAITAAWGDVSENWITENETAKYGGSSYAGFKEDGESYVTSWAANRLAYVDGIMQIVETVPTTSITLSADTLTFTNNVPQTLVATVTPENSTEGVIWESSNTGVATVEAGVVEPVGNGDCTITATSGSHSDICSVSVNINQQDEPSENDGPSVSAVQGNASVNSTDTKRVTVLFDAFRLSPGEQVVVAAKEGYSILPFMAYYSVDDSGYAGNNRIYVKCTYDDGAVLDSTEAQETIDSAYIIYTNSYNTNWTDEFVLVKSIHPTNAVTLNTYGLVVKKDDESNVTTEEVIANMTISREWATN